MNPSCLVKFQGFLGTAQSLSDNGWQVSISQERLWGTQFETCVAVYNPQLNMMGVSKPLEIECRELIRDHREFYPAELHERPKYVFEILSIAPRVEVMRTLLHNVAGPSALSFNTFDAMTPTYEVQDLRTMLPFMEHKPKEIIVNPEDVSFWLDKLLSAQEPQQKEIREKKIIANLSTF